MTSSQHASSPSAGILTGSLTDFRQTFRLLWKAKRITATTLITLALCIGATTAIFSSVYSLMLKPLPYQEPERIVELYTSAVKAGLNHMPANVPFYLDYSQNGTSYESLGLWAFFYGLVGDKDAVVRTPGARMTAEIFTILRIQPIHGSFFTKEQNKPGADKVIVLTQSYWQTQYQESPDVLGKEVRIDDEAYKVIGVAPRALEAFDARIKFVVPLSWPAAAENPQGRYGVGTQLFGRLKPGVTAGQADAEAKTLEKRYVDAGPPQLKQFAERSGMTMNVGGVQEQRVEPVRPTLLMLQGGVAFVLLIGCVNVANLLLVRSNARQSELAIRSALGAARATIARQFLMESLLLTSLGTLLGLGVAWGALRMTNYYLAKMLPQSLPASLDWRVLGFAVALTAAVGLVIGLDPGLPHPAHEPGGGASEQFARVVVEPRRTSPEQHSRRGPGRGRVDAPDRRRPPHPELCSGLESRHRTPAGERGHRAHRLDAGTSRQRRGRELDSRTPAPGDERDSGRDIGGAGLVHTFPGRIADQRVHARERHAAAGCAAAGRVPGDRDARVRPDAGPEDGGRPLLRRRGPGSRAGACSSSMRVSRGSSSRKALPSAESSPSAGGRQSLKTGL